MLGITNATSLPANGAELTYGEDFLGGDGVNVVWGAISNWEVPLGTIVYGRYSGTGTAGSSNPTVVNFGTNIVPMVVIISKRGGENPAQSYMTALYLSSNAKTYHPAAGIVGSTAYSVTLVWTGTVGTMSFYANSAELNAARAQLNEQGVIYDYAIIGAAKVSS